MCVDLFRREGRVCEELLDTFGDCTRIEEEVLDGAHGPSGHAQRSGRNAPIPIDEAKYLDAKVFLSQLIAQPLDDADDVPLAANGNERVASRLTVENLKQANVGR